METIIGTDRLMGCVANDPDVMVVKTDLRNVPRKENLALGESHVRASRQARALP